MDTPRPIVKSAVVVWSVALGLLFVIGYHALAVVGTKSSGTFKYVTPTTPGARPPGPPSPGKPDTDPPTPAR